MDIDLYNDTGIDLTNCYLGFGTVFGLGLIGGTDQHVSSSHQYFKDETSMQGTFRYSKAIKYYDPKYGIELDDNVHGYGNGMNNNYKYTLRNNAITNVNNVMLNEPSTSCFHFKKISQIKKMATRKQSSLYLCYLQHFTLIKQ